MRLEAITIRNYRLHHALTVELDPARTLIGGPNESGKSTLIEAAHRALFLRAKTGGEVQRGMISRTHGGHPEVELVFTTRGRQWRLLKRFSGAGGTATLTEIGGQSWSGAEAEEKLHDLLGTEAIGASASKLREQWAHLWVWQGCAGDDPTAHANTHRSDLLTRLQHEGGAAVVQSQNDQRVAEAVAKRFGELFKDNGDARAGSSLATAEAEETRATEALATAQQALARLDRAAGDFLAAEDAIRAATEALGQLQPQQHAVEEQLMRVAVLRSDEKLQQPAAAAATQRFAAAGEADTRIRRLRTEGAEAAAALAPLEAETAILITTEAERSRQAFEAEKAVDDANHAVSAVRLAGDLAAAQVQRFDKAATLDQVRARLSQVRGIREELRKLEAALAEVPSITGPKLTALQKLEREIGETTAARDAMAAGLEVLAADQSVRLGDRTLAAGTNEILSEETVLEIGTGVRLLIRPGGGTSLIDARQRVRTAEENLRRELDRIGLATVDEAGQALAKRQELASQIKAATVRLDAFGAEQIEEQFSVAEQASAAAEADVQRRIALAPPADLPATLDAAREQSRVAVERLQQAERTAGAANAERKAAAERLQEARVKLAAHTQAIQRSQHAATDLGARLRQLVENHGEDDARARLLADLTGEKAAADAVLTATRAALAELQPELLERDRERLARALSQHANALREAEERRALARGELQRDGTTDPHADLALAEERLRNARSQSEREQQRAEAVRLLSELFQAEQRALAEQFTRPLAARISRYLECLFGPGARAEVTLEAQNFSGLHLIRPGHADEAYAFEYLSGGVREQLAAAVRLALAEVLAETHDGCLPVVFDDAFAYSDPDRVQVLQRMLDVAADRGLQIIVLSCNPADYATLGAKQVTLRSETRPLVAPVKSVAPPAPVLPAAMPTVSSVAAPFNPNRPPTPAPPTTTPKIPHSPSPPAPRASVSATPGPVDGQRRDELLFRLHVLGGSTDDHTLRDDLGWSTETYETVKAELLAAGQLRAELTKGGSVTLAE